MKKNHSERAAELFCTGCNCSQAVLVAFAEDCGMDEKIAMKLSSSFGGGMGRLREVCGAFSGISLVVGALCGYGDAISDKKAEHYALIRELAEEFKSVNGGSIICRELLDGTEKLSAQNPAVRTEEYKHKRPCYEIVANSADILEKKLKEKGIL